MSTKVAHRHGDVFSLPRAVYTEATEPMTIKDPIYPRKAEVHKGSCFKFYGHSIENPTTWIVEDITTLSKDERGWLQHSVYNVRTSKDILTLRCESPWERRRLTFGWMSISAAWRLEVD
jgi:hypothetical protein